MLDLNCQYGKLLMLLEAIKKFKMWLIFNWVSPLLPACSHPKAAQAFIKGWVMKYVLEAMDEKTGKTIVISSDKTSREVNEEEQLFIEEELGMNDVKIIFTDMEEY